MSAERYARADGVVWRLGPDRVLVRRVGDHSETAAADLLGGAALVWIALDSTATIEELTDRLADAGLDTHISVKGPLDLLAAAGWLRTVPHA